MTKFIDLIILGENNDELADDSNSQASNGMYISQNCSNSSNIIFLGACWSFVKYLLSNLDMQKNNDMEDISSWRDFFFGTRKRKAVTGTFFAGILASITIAITLLLILGPGKFYIGIVRL